MGTDVRFVNTTLATARALPDALAGAGYTVTSNDAPGLHGRDIAAVRPGRCYQIKARIHEGQILCHGSIVSDPTKAFLSVCLESEGRYYLCRMWRNIFGEWKRESWPEVLAEFQKLAAPEKLEVVE